MGGIQEIRRVNKNSLEMEFEMSEMEHAYIDASEISRYSQQHKSSRFFFLNTTTCHLRKNRIKRPSDVIEIEKSADPARGYS